MKKILIPVVGIFGVSLAHDSKYKGAKGDHLKQLSDAARLAMKEHVAAGNTSTLWRAQPCTVLA